MNDVDDVGLIDVEARIRDRLAQAQRERVASAAAARAAGVSTMAAVAGGEGRRHGSATIVRRVGERVIALGTAIVEASRRLEPETDDGCQESPGAA